MTQNTGTLVIAPIVTPDSTDNFPTHISNMGKGGFHTVQALTDRDSISQERREEGMLCTVVDDGVTYQLLGGIDNNNWTPFAGGGSNSSEIDDSLITTTTTWSSSKILEKLTNAINDIPKKDTIYSYYPNGDIYEEKEYNISVVPNQLVQKKTYAYTANGDINTETIEVNGRKFVNTFIYNAYGDIFKIQTRETVI